MTILRGRITSEGTVELLDPIPDDFDRSQEVQVVITKKLSVYETVNDYGDRVIVDEENGFITPVEPFTLQDFVDAVGGIWSDRLEEFDDSAEWVRKLRDSPTHDKAWRGRTLNE
jgi:hypothetical protein